MGTPQSEQKDIYITKNIPFSANEPWLFTTDLSVYDDAVLIARKDYTEEPEFEWRVSTGELEFDGMNLVFKVDSAITNALTAGNYYYNLKFESTTETEFEGSHGLVCVINNTIE